MNLKIKSVYTLLIYERNIKQECLLNTSVEIESITRKKWIIEKDINPLVESFCTKYSTN